MSSSKSPSRRHFAGLALSALGMAVLLGGCQVRPLYGSLGSSAGHGSEVANELGAISLDTIGGISRRPAARELYNELTFKFQRGTSPTGEKYRLRVQANISTAAVSVQQFSDVPASYTMTMNAHFILTDIATDKALVTGRSFSTAAFDFSSQRFANERASRDAEERVAKAVAQDIHARLAGYFAQNR